MTKKKSSKYFPVKNYVYGALIIIAIILIGWYIISWYNVKKQDKLITSYLISTNTLTNEIKDINEIVQVLKESPSEYFVYISHTNDEDIYRLEKKLKKIIDDYNLKDLFYYVNTNEYMEDTNLNVKLNDAFNTTKINNTPCILYFKNNELKDVIIDKNSIFNVDDFTELLNNNEYEK